MEQNCKIPVMMSHYVREGTRIIRNKAFTENHSVNGVFSTMSFENCVFDHCTFDEALFYLSDFVNCRFTDVQILNTVELQTCMFYKCNFNGIHVTDKDAKLKLSKANFFDSTIRIRGIDFPYKNSIYIERNNVFRNAFNLAEYHPRLAAKYLSYPPKPETKEGYKLLMNWTNPNEAAICTLEFPDDAIITRWEPMYNGNKSSKAIVKSLVNQFGENVDTGKDISSKSRRYYEVGDVIEIERFDVIPWHCGGEQEIRFSEEKWDG